MCVVFDLDGTLLDSLDALRAAFSEFAAEFGIAADAALFERFNGPSAREIAAGLLALAGSDAPVEPALARYRALIARRAARARPFPEAEALLDAAALGGRPVALATSGARAEVESALDRLGWRSRFAAVACGDEAAHAKPSPDVYALALARARVPADLGVAVEDSANGARAARAAGLAVIFVGPEEVARAVVADFDPADLCAAPRPPLWAVSRTVLADRVCARGGARA